MSVFNKKFDDHDSIITGRDALLKYPNPRFFERPNPRMKMDELRGILQRNCDDAARIIEIFYRHADLYPMKRPIIETANKLHDFHLSARITSCEFGRPYLWEI